MPRRPVTLTPKKPRKPVETDEPKRRRLGPAAKGRREKKKKYLDKLQLLDCWRSLV